MLMYSHSPERNRVDVVDLDPYGTAAPFIDAAVQCITDGGMLFPPGTRIKFPPELIGTS
jgi:tRNA G26 N,N-dimethylase Trm1